MAKRKKKAEVILTPEEQREADYQKAVRRMEGAEKMLQPEDKVHMYREAMQMFEALGDYEDSEIRRKRCKKRLPLARREYREEIYQTGIRLKKEAKSAADYEAAITEFHRLRREYKDMVQQIDECGRLKEKAYRNERAKTIAGKILALAAIAVVIAAVIFLRSPAAYYMEGSLLMAVQDYERANTIFAKSKGYKDTDMRVRECNYQRALRAAENGSYTKAVGLLYDKVGDYKDALEKKAQYEMKVLSEADTGDTVTYGSTKWLVADTAAGPEKKLLLVRKKPVKEEAVYQTTGKDAVWEQSNMRLWLNSDFYEECFSKYEQDAILSTQIETKANSAYGALGGSVTNDRVFLLDEAEAEQYKELLTLDENQKSWWLRTPGKNAESAAFVSAEGNIMHYGYAADSKEMAVRPAVWIGLKQ